MVKCRLEGLPEEVAVLVEEMKSKGLDILAESKEYPNKNSQYVRVYIEIRM